MTYIELINRFWTIHRTDPFPYSDALLYLYLCDKCNSGRWMNPFRLSIETVSTELRIHRSTLHEAKNRLMQRGLIRFTKRSGRGGVLWQIMDVAITGRGLGGRLPPGGKELSAEATIKGEEMSARTTIRKELSAEATITPTINPTIPQFPHYNREEIRYKDIGDDARTHAREGSGCGWIEKFFGRFLSQDRALERFAAGEGLTPADVRQYAAEIRAEWELKGEPPKIKVDREGRARLDYTDTAKRLIATIRIKHQIAQRQQHHEADKQQIAACGNSGYQARAADYADYERRILDGDIDL